MVGKGDNVCCSLVCSQVPFLLHKHTFVIDFYVLPLNGSAIMLGIQWLKTLGPVTTDYLNNGISMECLAVTLQGINEGKVEAISSSQL